ncbi:MAG: transporter substrate-binding domain-containing protein [Acholeplasmataceae bacterium]|nr:transporter substrate-binding domain-containing protein [Acholeplasmataceae bacterium]
MKRFLIVVLLAIGGLSLSACSNSTNVFDFILDESYTEFVTMATSADYPPYENIVEDPKTGKNTVAGVDIEIAKAIANALGKNLRVIHKGFDFLVEDVRSGKVDFIIAAMTPTPSRQLIIDFSKSYYTEETVEQVVLIHKDNVDLYQSIEDLNASTVRVGAQTGSIQAEFAELFTPNATAKIIQDLNELLNNLNNDQIDALFTEGPVADTHMNNGYPDFIKLQLDALEGYDGNAVGVQKGNTALLTVINQVIDDLNAEGLISQWLTQYSE